MTPAARRSSPPVRREKRGPSVPAFLRHRNLMAAEAVLVVGVLKSWMEVWVKASSLSNTGKVLFIMAATLGLLGGLFYSVEKLTMGSVKKTHEVMRVIPLPYLLVHALVFAALFVLYAHHHGIPVF